MMRVLSIDPATKSLAVSIIDFNTTWIQDIVAIGAVNQELINREPDPLVRLSILKDWIAGVDQILNNLVKLKYVNVFDLLPGAKVDTCSTKDKIRRLKGVVEYVQFVNNQMDHSAPIDKVLIEYQMSSNDKSRGIASALTYAFASPDDNFSFHGVHDNFRREFANRSLQSTDVVIVGPALKGTLHFGDKGNMQRFREKYAGNYAGNKAHSKYNFLKWLADNGATGMIEGIPKANVDDVADSFMMAYAWYIKNFA